MSTKTDVLAIFEKQRDDFISGQELALKLHISRTAVWKAVKNLQEDGHKIIATTNKGYRLEQGSDLLSVEGIAAHLDDDSISITALKTVDSTNTYGKKSALEGAAHGSIIVSEEQSKGRGRGGKSFFSPEGSGLYLSVILRPNNQTTEPQMITIASSLAVCEAIEKLTGLKPQIKWVNDIFLDGRKVCGILTEAVTDFESGGIESIIVGIGINCSTAPDEFPTEIASIAGSLNFKGINRNQLAAEIATGVISYFKDLKNPKIIEEYRRRSLMLDKEISFVHGGVSVCGTVTGFNDLGNLIVALEDGSELVLLGGEVSINNNSILTHPKA